MSSRIRPASPPAIEHAARLLREGQLVAFPTETVYGLGADARWARREGRTRCVHRELMERALAAASATAE